ncbi:uncharacterized protein LOC119647952 isoform X2 [Hermetia illucens]|uniref:uncharacterized protein LOC119647952 isoform X2 n=1 Tax=Hermetia illucens TaxID=343691 RepID=UPI0018CC7713|nr:uncharacterized protein LOC119647952 isoform X2 [Hermetia illucens]
MRRRSKTDIMLVVRCQSQTVRPPSTPRGFRVMVNECFNFYITSSGYPLTSPKGYQFDPKEATLTPGSNSHILCKRLPLS